MTLTWRDVATPQLRGPDFTDAANAITRGIAGLGQSVQDIANAPSERRQAEIAGNMMLAATGQKFLDQNKATAEHDADRNKKLAEDAAITEFGAVQSDLMGMALMTGQNGGKITDVTQSELFRSLSPLAQGRAQGILATTFAAGQDDRRAQQNADRSYALQQQQERRMAHESSVRIAAAQKAEKAAKDAADPLNYIKHQPTKDALMRYTADVRSLAASVDLSQFTGKNPTDILATVQGLPRSSWYHADAADGAAEISNAWAEANERLKANGMPALPPEAMAFAAQSNAGDSGFFGTTEPTDWMYDLGVTRASAEKATKDIFDMMGRAKAGEQFKYDESKFVPQREKPKPRPAPPVLPAFASH